MDASTDSAVLVSLLLEGDAKGDRASQMLIDINTFTPRDPLNSYPVQVNIFT